MYGESILNVFLLSCVSIVFTTVKSTQTNSCPPRAVHTAMACTASVGFFGQPTQFLDKSLDQRLSDGCTDGTFLDAVNCIERVVRGCQNETTDGGRWLRSNVDVEKMRNGIIYFCTNVNEYIASVNCIKDQMDEVANCSHAARKKFMSQTYATKDQDALMGYQCTFFSKAVSCQVNILRDRCSPEVGDIVSRVMRGFEPPICAGSSSYNVIEGGVDDGRTGDNLSSENDGNAASSIPRLSLLYFVFSVFLLHHLIKVSMS